MVIFQRHIFPSAAAEIFYIPERGKQVMNRYNIPGMAFLKFVTPCKILLCGYCVFSLVSKLCPAVIFQFFREKVKIHPSGHWSHKLPWLSCRIGGTFKNTPFTIRRPDFSQFLLVHFSCWSGRISQPSWRSIKPKPWPLPNCCKVTRLFWKICSRENEPTTQEKNRE